MCAWGRAEESAAAALLAVTISKRQDGTEKAKMTVVVTTWSSMFPPANTIDGEAAVGALGAIVNGTEIVEDLLLAIVMTVTAIGEGVEVEIGIDDDDRRCWTL